jgi:isovaleryl-CoA dehydrogenase
MQALADARLLGLNAPRRVGGHDEGLTGLVAVSHQLAREGPSAALCFAMHCVGTAVISAKATDAQTEEFLVPIARGEHISTLALSEPGTGSEFWVSETELRRVDGGYEVAGVKSFVTNGGYADSYVMSTVAAADADETGTFSCVLLPKESPGMEWQEEWHGFGMRSNSSRSVKLNDVHIPQKYLLGKEGDQNWYIFEVVAPYFLMAMAGTYIGVAEAAFEEALGVLQKRRHSHSGELVGASSQISSELAQMWIKLQAAQRLVYDSAIRADNNDPDALLGLLAAKAVASEAAVDIANDAMTLTGGSSYRENSKLARLLRDARASHVMAPTTHSLHAWLGRALLQLPLL